MAKGKITVEAVLANGEAVAALVIARLLAHQLSDDDPRVMDIRRRLGKAVKGLVVRGRARTGRARSR